MAQTHRAGDIAIVGMSGRFPGASGVEAFWRNLISGTESIMRFTEEELLASGVDPQLLAEPGYVPARPVLNEVKGFDASFFRYSPRDAIIADPQQRIFLECSWEALEQAGYPDPETRGRVGIFAGANLSTYMLGRYGQFQDELGASDFEVVTGNDKDALATMVAYKLNLTGPSVSVQTFCSTSLVGVHLACQALRAGECELALAGGVSVRVPDRVGHLFEPGGQESPDGHVRTFDAEARGSMFGDGAAVVLLKPLHTALADRDTVLAVIRGSAVSNDGTMKLGFTAPSIVGQAKAVSDALAAAGVCPEEVSYVEAHGTATELGDPIEVAALTRAFGPVEKKQYCAIGSAKTNVGHLDRASGVTGLIKVVLSLREEVIPPTLHFQRPNPEINFGNSPFRVEAEALSWPRRDSRPRIAGVSSLGMGGTNVHVVVEEPPERADGAPGPRRHHVLPVSARSETALEESCSRLAKHLTEHEPEIEDVAFTLQAGRQVFEHRRIAVADSSAAAAALFTRQPASGRVHSRRETARRRVGFLISGVGEQYPGMVAQLYATEPTFRAQVDECRSLLGDDFPEDLADLLCTPVEREAADILLGDPASSGDDDSRAHALRRTEVAQPAAFVVGYALARTLMEWGVEPGVMVGYSVGEYVAACLSGVLSLPDALRLVVRRAQLIDRLPNGSMLAVALTEAALRTRVPDLSDHGVDLAADNGVQVVVAGETPSVRALAEELRAQDVACSELPTTHAFHSRMLAELCDELTDWIARTVTLNPPRLRYVSNVTGELASEDLVTDPAYWGRHMCETVRFNDGLTTALSDSDIGFVEIGPGQSLGAMLRAHPDCDPSRWGLIVPCLPGAAETRPDDLVLAETIGKLWLIGVPVNWTAYHGLGDGPAKPESTAASRPAKRPGRIPLPTYPFQRQDFWLESKGGRLLQWGHGQPGGSGDPRAEAAALPKLPEEQWFHLPVWQQTAARFPAVRSGEWIILTDAGSRPIADALAARLAGSDCGVTRVLPGSEFGEDPDAFTIRPGEAADAQELLAILQRRGRTVSHVVHLWNLGATDMPDGGEHTNDPGDTLRRGLYSLVALAQAAGNLDIAGWTLDVVSAGTQRVLASDAGRLIPERATVLGPCRLIPLEYPGTGARLIDVVPGALTGQDIEGIVSEVLAKPVDQVVAFRDGQRWVPAYDVMPRPTADADGPASAGAVSGLVRPGGVYLITGGLGGIGLSVAQRLVDEFAAKVVLLGRTPIPPRGLWETILDGNTASPTVRRRLESLRAMEAHGARVAIVTGDVTDPTVVQQAINVAHESFGGLDGVFHAAGVPGVGLTQFKTAADIDQVLAPKVRGTTALAQCLREQPVSFLVLFSSITSATGGGAGQLDYCAANAFLDAYAFSGALPDVHVVAVDWGEWEWNGWTDGLDGYTAELRSFFEKHRARFGISFDQGWHALLDILQSGEPQVVVSTQDFSEMVRLSRRFTLDDIHRVTQQDRSGIPRHPRPDLSVPFVAPRSDTEQAIAEVWQEALGLQQIGVNDNFFELGGNSLIGVSIVSQIRKSLQLDRLAPNSIIQAPTVAELAAAATPSDGEPGGGETDAVDQAAQRRRIDRRKQSLLARQQ